MVGAAQWEKQEEFVLFLRVKCMEHAANQDCFAISLFMYILNLSSSQEIVVEFDFRERGKFTLTVETENRHQYSKEFTALVKDFYLKL